jgi:hypothetical protein
MFRSSIYSLNEMNRILSGEYLPLSHISKGLFGLWPEEGPKRRIRKRGCKKTKEITGA